MGWEGERKSDRIEREGGRWGGSVDLLKSQTRPVSPPTHPLTLPPSPHLSFSLPTPPPTPSWRDGTAPETGRSRSSINREELLSQEPHTNRDTHTVSPLSSPYFVSFSLSVLLLCSFCVPFFLLTLYLKNANTHTPMRCTYKHAHSP